MIRSPRHHPLVSLAATALLAVACALLMVCTNAQAANEDGSPTTTAEVELPPPLKHLREARLAVALWADHRLERSREIFQRAAAEAPARCLH